VHRRAAVVASAALLVLPLGSCSSSDDHEKAVTVLAASSLTEAFTTLADAFEEKHDGVKVRLSFGSSTTLADQAGQGAPGDVLATADEDSMAIAEEARVLTDGAVVFAENQMVLVVPADNPAKITSYTDLKGALWVRCADDVPCGRVANMIIALNSAMGGFQVNHNRAVGDPASLEVDVKSVLAKVTSGEADAGFVYATDAKAAGDDVRVIEVPHSREALTRYSIAQLNQADDDDLAAEFVELVLSADGQQALAEAGFTALPPR
jgi:molybdate transport system substrate-binding protein